MSLNRLIILHCFVAWAYHAAAQPTLLRQTTGMAGCSISSTHLHVQSSTGQASPIGMVNSENITLRQGFIQPYLFTRKVSQLSNYLPVVYPNPTVGNIHIDFNSPSDYKIEIVDLSGKLMQTLTGSDTKIITLSLATYPAGVYHLRGFADRGYFSCKIVKL